MNLNKEIIEFRKTFKSAGILTKLFLVLGFFFAVSSITSLSSVVVQWKGFILGALNFYQLYFVSPIAQIASTVGFHYSKTEIHVATITSICLTVGMRLLAIGQIIAFREINRKFNSDLVPSLSIYWFGGIFVPIGIWCWYGISDPIIRPWYVILVCVFYPTFIVVPKLIMSKLGYVAYESGHFSYAKGYYVYMTAVFLIIGALAAINSGLQEVNPQNLISSPLK